MWAYVSASAALAIRSEEMTSGTVTTGSRGVPCGGWRLSTSPHRVPWDTAEVNEYQLAKAIMAEYVLDVAGDRGPLLAKDTESSFAAVHLEAEGGGCQEALVALRFWVHALG